MARIRSVKPELPQDAKLASVSRVTRYHFLLVLTVCDDEGYFRANPRSLLGQLYVHDVDVTEADVLQMNAALESVGIVTFVVTPDGAIGWVRNWKKHQKIDRPSKSHLSEAFARYSREPREGVATGEGVLSPESRSPDLPSPRRETPEMRQLLDVFPKVADALLPIEGHDVLLDFMRWAPEKDKLAYLGECSAALEGMHGVMLNSAELRTAIADWLTKGASPDLRHFRGFLRNAKARPSPEGSRSPPRSGGGVAARTFANGVAALSGFPDPSPE